MKNRSIWCYKIKTVVVFTFHIYHQTARDRRPGLCCPTFHPVERFPAISEIFGVHAETGGEHLGQQDDIGARF